MAKFDYLVNLPKIFRNNNLSILPISHSQYIIGHFKTHLPVKYNQEIISISWQFPPNIESIDYTNLYSESSGLLCTFNLGMIDDLVSAPTKFTISGRIYTNSVEFKIINSQANQPYSISNDIFNFFIYQFTDTLNYNSINLVEQKSYEIVAEEIQGYEVDLIFKNIQIIPKLDIPFPQADKFERLVDLVSLLSENDLISCPDNSLIELRSTS